MVQLIVGEKGKGKSKHLLDKVNAEILSVSGNIVYLDTSTKHMYELNNKVRLINVSDYMVENSDEFLGFICGIISQDHDLEKMYFDNFLKISLATKDNLESVIHKLERIGEGFGVRFVISVGLDISDISEAVKDKVVLSL